MNYDDELERARAKRSRKRENAEGAATRNTKPAASSIQEAGTAGTAARTSRAGQTASGSRPTYRRRKKKSQKKKIIIAVVIALLLVIAAAGFGVYKYFDNKVESMDPGDFNKTEVQNLNISEEKRDQMEKGFLTVAVFGVDSRDNSLGKGNQSDVIMIANLDRETGEIKLVSVFRDTYLNVSDKDSYNKINAAYASGGPEAAVKALNKNLDLNITHYATFNWKAVATVINILGGVEIDISPSEFYYINAFITETVNGTGIGSTQLSGPGVHNLDGVQAVAYGRLRLMDSDYARTERQRIVLQKAFDKLKQSDLATLNSVVGHVMEMSATNIRWEELLELATGISKYHLGETAGFPAARGEAKIKIGGNKLSCVIPQTLESNVISLHQFLYNETDYVPSETVKTISAKIANVSGLATEAEEIGHVAVDKGYIPKKTTAAATEAPEETTKEATLINPNDSSESESESLGEGESEAEGESPAEGESESNGESGSAAESESETVARPGIGGITETEETIGGSDGPGGPLSSSESAENYGPGSVVRPGSMTGPAQGTTSASSGGPGAAASTEAETTEAESEDAAGAESEEETSAAAVSGSPAGSATVIGSSPSAGTTAATTAAAPTAAAPGSSPSSPTTALSPSSPADITISPGSSLGPASQATSAAAGE